MVVKTRAPQPLVIKLKSQWTDKVEGASCIGGQPDDISGIGWYLGLIEDDMKHHCWDRSLFREKKLKGVVEKTVALGGCFQTVIFNHKQHWCVLYTC